MTPEMENFSQLWGGSQALFRSLHTKTVATCDLAYPGWGSDALLVSVYYQHSSPDLRAFLTAITVRFVLILSSVV